MTPAYEKRQEALRQLAEDRKALSDGHWEWLMGDARGRACMAEVLYEWCGFERSTEAGESVEGHCLNGMRRVALRLASHLATVCPEKFFTMRAEADKAAYEATLLARETPTHDD